MKRVALALLVGAALLYALATALRAQHPGWGYLAAFAEAAMVGAMADWFAVVALFRHPLGLPIPHTAIIPDNKDRIGENLANFLCEHFLSTPQVLARLTDFDAAGRLAQWLAAPSHAAQVGQQLVAAARWGLGALGDARVRLFVGELALGALRQVDAARLTGQVLDGLTRDGRHQELLDSVLQRLATTLDDEELQRTLTDAIAREIKALRYVGLDQVAARHATRKIVAAIARTIADMAMDPQHALRQRFDGFMAGFIERLNHDSALQQRAARLRDELLAHPALGHYLQSLWSDLLAWLHADLDHEDSSLRRYFTDAAQTLGERLQQDTDMRSWINGELLAAAPPLIERYREDIRRYIVTRVQQWNAREMSLELERNIGRDLQFIRINGTLVGGLVGLGIHALTEWLRRA